MANTKTAATAELSDTGTVAALSEYAQSSAAAINLLTAYAAVVASETREGNAEHIASLREQVEVIDSFSILAEKMPNINFVEDFDAQVSAAQSLPRADIVSGFSPEAVKSGMNGLEWYARESLTVAGLENQDRVLATLAEMGAIAQVWECAQPEFARQSQTIVNDLRAELAEAEQAKEAAAEQAQSKNGEKGDVTEKSGYTSVLAAIEKGNKEKQNRPPTQGNERRKTAPKPKRTRDDNEL